MLICMLQALSTLGEAERNRKPISDLQQARQANIVVHVSNSVAPEAPLCSVNSNDISINTAWPDLVNIAAA
jgi:hypothetical protein